MNTLLIAVALLSTPEPTTLQVQQEAFLAQNVELAQQQEMFLEEPIPPLNPAYLSLEHGRPIPRLSEEVQRQLEPLPPAPPPIIEPARQAAPVPKTFTPAPPRKHVEPLRVIPLHKLLRHTSVKLPKPFKLVPLEFPMVFPLAKRYPITSWFGWRGDPFLGTSRLHAGIDMGAPTGTPVFAVRSGLVHYADVKGGYGNLVELDHGQERTRYAHLSQISVKKGQFVKQSTLIGYVGSTGRSTGPHLHFELLLKQGAEWLAVNPRRRLRL
jgi:murein DD-endopeptidase MepM/ murein hydrolase activator NlpD